MSNPDDQMENTRVIPVRGPFRLATALNVLFRYDEPPRDLDRPARGSFTLEVPGGAVEVTLAQDESGQPVRMTVHGDCADEDLTDTIRIRVKRMFSLAVDPSTFFETVEEDENLRLPCALYPDLRPVLYFSPFEAVVRLIISQGLTPEQTSIMIRNLREVAGIVPAGRPYAQPAFPGKYTLLALPDKMLEIAGLSKRKIQSLKRLTVSMDWEPDHLDALYTIRDPVKIRRLVERLPGSNRRLTDKLLTWAYGFQDMIPDDPRLFLAVKRFYRLPDFPDADTVARLADRYIPWRSWWAYLITTANETSVIV